MGVMNIPLPQWGEFMSVLTGELLWQASFFFVLALRYFPGRPSTIKERRPLGGRRKLTISSTIMPSMVKNIAQHSPGGHGQWPQNWDTGLLDSRSC